MSADERPESRGRGRPTDYKPEFLEIAANLCAVGATDFEVAQALDCGVSTLYAWKARYPEFREAMRVGKELADDRVEASLYHRAVGYSHPAVKIFMPAGATEPVYAEYTEHVAPDPSSAKMWLTNRKPDVWRDKSSHELTGKDGKPLVPAGQSVAAAVAAAAAIAAAKDPVEAAKRYQDLMAAD